VRLERDGGEGRRGGGHATMLLRATAARKREVMNSSSAASGRCWKVENCGASPAPYKLQYFENAVSRAAASESAELAPKFEAINVKTEAAHRHMANPIADAM
jgi:hypothetical protein